MPGEKGQLLHRLMLSIGTAGLLSGEGKAEAEDGSGEGSADPKSFGEFREHRTSDWRFVH
jgi:hypothetical protein